MLAHIVVDNRTGHAIHANGCGQLFELALGSDSYPAQAGWPPCLTTLTIAVGRSSYPWTIRATYDSCGGTGIQPLPACLPGGGAPPLPPGQYSVVFFQSSNLVSEPAPIPVQVTPRSLLRHHRRRRLRAFDGAAFRVPVHPTSVRPGITQCRGVSYSLARRAGCAGWTSGQSCQSRLWSRRRRYPGSWAMAR